MAWQLFLSGSWRVQIDRHSKEMTPNLIFLAGPSCSGKTDLAQELQRILPEPWVHWHADRCQPSFPDRQEFLTSENDRKMVEANLRAIRSYSEAGFKVLAEIFIWDPESLLMMKDLLKSTRYEIVKLECPLETLEDREVARGSTYIGTARRQAELRLDFDADLTLDSSQIPAAELATRIAGWLQSRGSEG